MTKIPVIFLKTSGSFKKGDVAAFVAKTAAAKKAAGVVRYLSEAEIAALKAKAPAKAEAKGAPAGNTILATALSERDTARREVKAAKAEIATLRAKIENDAKSSATQAASAPEAADKAAAGSKKTSGGDPPKQGVTN